MGLNLADFLQIEPEFEFDPVEYLRAVLHSAHLKCRFDTFRDATFRRGLSTVEPALLPFDLPRMTKQDLRGQSEALLAGELGERWHYKQTMGTTGRPVCVVMDELTHLEMMYLILDRIAVTRRIPLSSGEVYSVSLIGRLGQSDQVFVRPQDGRLMLRLRFDEREEGAAERVQKVLRRWRPSIVAAKPLVFEQMLEGLDLSAWRPPDLLVSSGDHLTADVRAKTEAALGAPIADAYAITEAGLVASECPGGEMHIDETSCQVEVYTDRSIEPTGVGVLLVTSLVNQVTRVVRYDTGDRAEVVRGQCSCGWWGGRIRSLEGRRVTRFRLPSGVALDPTRLHHRILVEQGATEFRLTQTAIDAIQLEVAFPPGTDPAAAARTRDAIAEWLPGVRLDVRNTTFPDGAPHDRYCSRLAD